MLFNIEVYNVKSETKPTKTGNYTQIDVAYKNLTTGKNEGKKLVSFKNPDVFKALQHAPTGSTYTITSEKPDGEQYWTWVKAAPMGETSDTPPVSGTKAFASPKSTYETPEERAQKQVYIIRQSSLSNAIDTLSINAGKDKLDPTQVLELAQTYSDWVFEKNVKKAPSFDLMEDDIPL